MNGQTKSYSWLPWLVSVAAVLLLGILATYFKWQWVPVGPWTEAAGLSAIIAINEFGEGIADLAPHWEPRMKSLVSLIVIFILGPSLWIYSEFKNQQSSGEESQNQLKKGFLWYVGATIICAGLMLAVPATIIKGVVFNNTWESAAKNKNVDELRGALWELGYDAFELYYLPRNLGGGAGSFYISENGAERSLKLSDLESYNMNSNNSFYLSEEVNDSTITIYGVGYKQSDDLGFKNIDGDSGKIQVSLTISPPAEENYFELETNSE